MSFVQDTSVQLATAAVAFALGLLLNRFRTTWAYFKARKFWRPVLRRDLTLVLGDGFFDLQGFEASDMIGRGDLVASYELTTRFSTMGFRRLQPVFADKMIGDDPAGTRLRRSLIILGGRDANTLAEDCISRLNCAYELKWPASDSVDAADDLGPAKQKAPWTTPTLSPTDFAGSSQVPENAPACIPFQPTVKNGIVTRDYGVIIRARNPFLSCGASHKSVIMMYGCYGFGTLAAVLYSQEESFLNLVTNSDDDIECVVACDVIKDTPQYLHQVYFRAHPMGTLNPHRERLAESMPIADISQAID